MRCPFCGTFCFESAKFCSNCGKEIIPAPPEEDGKEPINIQMTGFWKSYKKWIIVVIAAMVVSSAYLSVVSVIHWPPFGTGWLILNCHNDHDNAINFAVYIDDELVYAADIDDYLVVKIEVFTGKHTIGIDYDRDSYFLESYIPELVWQVTIYWQQNSIHELHF